MITPPTRFQAESADSQGGFYPEMPRPETRLAAVLEGLQRGERFTTADAIRRGFGWRLAADIHQLRCKGWHIVTDLIPQRRGNPIARYWMPADSRRGGAPYGPEAAFGLQVEG